MNLFFFISAPAAAGKGNLHWSRRLGSVINKRLNDAYRNAMDLYNEQMAIYEATKKEERGEKPIKPNKQKLFIAGNSSTSSIINTLFSNGFFGIIFETEADTLVYILKSEWGNFSDVIRKGWHHEPILLQRRTNDEDVEIERPYLSMVLSGTPAQVKSLLSSIENGFFSRFLMYDFSNTSQWLDVFDNRLEPLEQFFDSLAVRIDLTSQPYFQPIAEDYSNRIKFDLTESQKTRFNEWFTNKLSQLQHIYGSDIVASVKRLGVCCFRIAMLLSTLRNIELKEEDLKGLSEEKYIICLDSSSAIACNKK